MTTSGEVVPAGSTKKTSKGGVIILVVIVLAVMGGAAACISSVANTKPDPKVTGLVSCQDDVKGQLQAPESASFDAVPDTWTENVIDGHLTARNQLGGTIDLRYHCDISNGVATTSTVKPG